VRGLHCLIDLARSIVTKSEDRGDHFETWEPAPLAVQAVRRNLTDLMPPSQADRLLASTDAQTFNAGVALLSPSTRADLDSLSPSSRLSMIRAPVYLMVDESDTLIPPAQSASIAGHLHQSGAKIYLSRFHIFQHVEPGGGHPPVALIVDVVRLFVHIRTVLSGL